MILVDSFIMCAYKIILLNYNKRVPAFVAGTTICSWNPQQILWEDINEVQGDSFIQKKLGIDLTEEKLPGKFPCSERKKCNFCTWMAFTEVFSAHIQQETRSNCM